MHAHCAYRYLGEGKEFNIDALAAFAQCFNFKGCTYVSVIL